MTKVRVWMMAATVMAIVGLVLVAGSGVQGQAVENEVPKIAAALKKGDKDTAIKLAADYRKKAEDVDDTMELFKLKSKGGIGFGAGTPKAEDGIEVMIRKAASGDAKYAKDAAKWEELVWNAAAIGLIAEQFTPAKGKGKGTVPTWKAAVADLQAGTAALAKAKNDKDLKAAANRINTACINCHSEWKQ